MTIQQNTIFICDSCGDTVHNVPPQDWWAIGRFKDQMFQCDKHICAKCYARIFEFKVAAEVMRIQ